MSRAISLQEVAKHNTVSDLWMAIDGKVYDLTKFARFHPGGPNVLGRHAGTDASKEFNAIHKPEVLEKYSKFIIGTVEGVEAKKITYIVDHCDSTKKFGATDVPYAEPYWYNGVPTPYYSASHAKFRKYVRDFTDKYLMRTVTDMDETGTYTSELVQQAAASGLYYVSVRYCCQDLVRKGIIPAPPAALGDYNNFDDFHDLIMGDEIARCGAGGVLAGVFVSLAISLPCILMAGSEEMKKRVVPEALSGKKMMCLGITEPYGGSDVANLRTTARKDGNDYILSGEKKFITTGCKADYFVVAARTGDKGYFGISLFLLEKGMPGLEAKRIKTQGWLASNTAFLSFDNVRVPAKNMIGEENNGFLTIMHQFNHERMMGINVINRFSRVCLEDAVRYIRVRETFGQKLVKHQVIRHKIAEMARKIEAIHANLEQLTYQMMMGAPEAKLAGPIALLKVSATKDLEFCAREASQCLGGNSFVRAGGFGERVERIYREVRVNAIGGGSEEIMLELGTKAAKL